MKKYNVTIETITESGIYPAWGETETIEIELESISSLEKELKNLKEDFISSLLSNNSDYTSSAVAGLDLVKLDTYLTVELFAEEIEDEEDSEISYPYQCGSGEERMSCSAPNGWEFCG